MHPQNLQPMPAKFLGSLKRERSGQIPRLRQGFGGQANSKFKKGQGLLEVILAMAIFAAIAGTLITMSVGGFRGLEQGGEQTEAEGFAEEGMEAIRSIHDRAWNEITGVTAQVGISSGKWVITGTGDQTGLGTNGKFTRAISFADVCRDNTSQNIVACGAPSSYTDLHSKKVTATITWTTRGGQTNTVQKIAYLTNWDSREWVEDTTAQFTDVGTTFTSTQEDAAAPGGEANGAVTLQKQ